MNLGESFISQYYLQKGYTVNKISHKEKIGYPDLFIGKGIKNFYVEEKTNGSDLTPVQENNFIKLLEKGNKILISKTNLILRVIRVYQINNKLEREFLFSLKIRKNFDKKSFLKCPYCGEINFINQKNKNKLREIHSKRCIAKLRKKK